MAGSGYTLPIFALAAAKAGLCYLLHNLTDLNLASTGSQVRICLPELSSTDAQVWIPVEQIARLDSSTALAITRSDPGDHLDLTRHTPIWAWIQLVPRGAVPMVLESGDGLGRHPDGSPAIYQYARQAFAVNLEPLIPGDQTVTVRIILPEGRQLAQRTSNVAFGILDGLALLGTRGTTDPVTTADYLDSCRHQLQQRLEVSQHLVFYIGSHGHQVAQQLGIPEEQQVQTSNWLGALLVEAGVRGAHSVRLIGYHGKLLKLAGGIFNTSSHVADARLEILSAALVQVNGSLSLAQRILQSPTADAAYHLLQAAGLAEQVYTQLAHQICVRAQNYVHKYSDRRIPIGVVLFDRSGQIIVQKDPI